MRNTMKNWMLGTALAAGLLGTGVAVANAAPQEFRGRPEARFDGGRGREFYRPAEHRVYTGGFGYAGGPVVAGYIPPCPGDGYVWLGGAWVFQGRPGFYGGYRYGRDVRFDHGYRRGFYGRR